jgi:NAD(P)-dependent dehydrogenase (short-subunit alcohol dehydrogenase family)
MAPLVGRVAIVTGEASGIGKVRDMALEQWERLLQVNLHGGV